MSESDGPFQFTEGDLELSRLRGGAEQTLADFYTWRDDNADAVAERIIGYESVLADEVALHGGLSVMRRWLRPAGRIEYEQEKLGRWAGVFELFNAGAMPDADLCRRIGRDMAGNVLRVETELAALSRGRMDVSQLAPLLAVQFPELAGSDELDWTGDRIQRLYRVLPDVVITEGGMGKVVRTVLGVLALAAYDTFDEPDDVRRARMRRVLPGAYAYAAAYVIVDDTLQDMPGHYVSAADKGRYHDVISEGLATGEMISADDLPDHPLAAMLHEAYDTITRSYPIGQYPHLYHAGASLYHAQYDESEKSITEAGGRDVTSLYINTMIKGAMTRVVADILADRKLDDGFYSRIINTVIIGQLRDDMGDRIADRRADSVTPFTVPLAGTGVNPLYDLFAYDAYAAARVFGGDVGASDALCYANAAKCAVRLHAEPRLLEGLLRDYACTAEMRSYLLAAARLPGRVVRSLTTNDIRVSQTIGEALSERPATESDVRTYVTDRKAYINAVIDTYIAGRHGHGVGDVVRYALDGEGKRLRPALTLMLAEGLGVDSVQTEPLLAAIEVFHSASLVFDDLPAQDDAALRRGRPTAHHRFPEYAAQIAGVSMIAGSFGMLGRLREHFPSDRVAAVIEYVGSVLGGQLCDGQYLDLAMERGSTIADGDKIMDMYMLKTSSMLEAALVPLMMLTGRPQSEIAAMKQFATHAGIVYQIRDDILDATSSPEKTGKDTGADGGKYNLVRMFGLNSAQFQLGEQLELALACVRRLPFDTSLLQDMVTYFAERRR